MGKGIDKITGQPVSIFLSSKIYKVWTHAKLLTSSQLIHTESSCCMLIGHFIPGKIDQWNDSNLTNQRQVFTWPPISCPPPGTPGHASPCSTPGPIRGQYCYICQPIRVHLDLGVDPLHQGVPLHQHVSEGGAREDPDHLGAQSRQIVKAAGEYFVNLFLIFGSHIFSVFPFNYCITLFPHQFSMWTKSILRGPIIIFVHNVLEWGI